MNCECVANFLTAGIAVIGFITTVFTLYKGNKEKSIANVIALKAEFRQYDDISMKLLPAGTYCNENPQPLITNNSCHEFNRLITYLGLFEVAHIMILTGILSKDEFKTFFVYRLINLQNSEDVREIINSDRESWKNLIQLMMMFDLHI